MRTFFWLLLLSAIMIVIGILANDACGRFQAVKGYWGYRDMPSGRVL